MLGRLFMLSQDTIVALSTPPGESALAVIRISGCDCLRLMAEAFGHPTPPSPRRALLSCYQDRSGRQWDEGLLCYFPAPSSYTGEDVLEYSCHGNVLIYNEIMSDLIRRGCRLAGPGEFTRRAFMSGKMDLTQAEAVADLIAARSEQALTCAQRQLGGDLGRRITAMQAALLESLAALEAYIDFPEDDLPEEDAGGPLQALTQLQAEVAALLRAGRNQAHLNAGLNVVIAGPPNAGKSTLLNALLGHARALVSDQPGTTRDYLTETLRVGPYAINLTDTAGLRLTDQTLEQKGMDRTRDWLARADIVIVVIDTTAPLTSAAELNLAHFSPSALLVLENKTDLPDSTSASAFFPEATHLRMALARDPIEPVLDRLLRMIQALSGGIGEETPAVNQRQAQALEQMLAALDAAQELLRQHAPTELACAHLREAVDALGGVVGRIDNEAMLDKLFARFCIGK